MHIAHLLEVSWLFGFIQVTAEYGYNFSVCVSAEDPAMFYLHHEALSCMTDSFKQKAGRSKQEAKSGKRRLQAAINVDTIIPTIDRASM